MSRSPAGLTLQQRLILDHLRHTRGAVCSMARLVAVVYGDRHDGGPLAPNRTIRVQMHHIRRWLAPRGVSILTIGMASGTLGYMIDTEDYERLEQAVSELQRIDVDLARAREPR